MKSHALRHARTLLSPLLLLLITTPVLKAGKTGKPAAEVHAASLLTPPIPDQQLLINLMVVLPGNVEALADGLRMRFNTGYLKSISDDAVKMNNFAENISSYRENTELIVERRPPIISMDTVFLRITNTTIRDYRLKMYAKSFGQNMVAYIQDACFEKHQVISLNGDTSSINFSVTANPASQASNRFRIIFVTYGTLPVHFTGISALPGYNNVQVQWTAADDKEVARYDIERSSNGTDFLNVGAVNAGSNGSYSWVDQHPVSGINYYRIHSTGMAGEITYSTVVKAAVKNAGSDITVYPNPVVNKTINVLFTNMDKGTYQLRLINTNGVAVSTQQIVYAGGNVTEPVVLNPGIATGTYQLEIIKPDKSRWVRAVVITN